MKNDSSSKIIPFYGGIKPKLFEIERRCMDRKGKVIEYLDERLPDGLVLDVGAGNGFTAEKLSREGRLVLPMEPDEKMIDRSKNLIWCNGVAQSIPFHANTFDAMYSTWAFFFDGIKDIDEGLSEVERVVKDGGRIVIVDNYGDDEFCSYSPNDITSSVDPWVQRGYEYEVIHTEFIFDHVREAKELLTFYFGEQGNQVNTTTLEYKVVAYTKVLSKSDR
ncbi:class I SAM-dependent methyltransferase [Bhargavaea beijingensis]|uniref:Class I SAM-dependent methyltransferase n=1 Tax=Bhargavaea beijingensis TaxID=426756 RepID=A0A1G6Y3I8_9BACL|nr:class I SAM-dependent methyltransferase [Bhargavaea beijingensis]RSK31868.1 class I SAM-dependent methyltransferase [Bhargavaea beijingensis]SDD84195.1 Methyltransferase domain-containing protein [Bhargavaea beijingensis]